MVAAAIIEAMARTGMSYAELEARIGKKPGFVKRWLNKYIEGSTNEGRTMTDLCCALGGEPQVRLVFYEDVEPAPQQPTPLSSGKGHQ